MKRILLAILIGAGALAAALFVGSRVASQVRAQVVTARVVVARQPIAAYTVISADMVEMQDLPREVTKAPIYLQADEVVGKMARLDIPSGVPIYTVYAVLPSDVRFTEDGAAVILSVPIDTVRAVGGLVQAGHRVDIYRIAKARPQGDRLLPEDLLALHGAAVEMVSTDVRVLGVKATGATQVTNKVESNSALPGLAVPLVPGVQRQGGTGVDSASGASQTPGPVRSAGAESISIVTVEVSQRVAVELLRLVGELSDRYDLWLTLSPTERDGVVLAEVAPMPAREREARLVALTQAPTAAPTATSMPTTAPTSTPVPASSATPVPGVVIRPGSAQGLNVRSGPGLSYSVLTTLAAGTRLEPVGRDQSGQWLAVCCIAPGASGPADAVGWVLAQMVDLGQTDLNHLPLLAAPLLPTVEAQPTSGPIGPEYRAEVSYANEPGDKRLNYIRASVLAVDGKPIRVALTMSWPDGSVSCPGDREPKAEGYCEFTVTEGEFTVTPVGFDGQPVRVTLPQAGQHTIANVTWRRLRLGELTMQPELLSQYDHLLPQVQELIVASNIETPKDRATQTTSAASQLDGMDVFASRIAVMLVGMLSRTEREGAPVPEIAGRFARMLVGVGVLQPFLEDDEVEEVMVRPGGRVFVDRAGRIEDLGQLAPEGHFYRVASFIADTRGGARADTAVSGRPRRPAGRRAFHGAGSAALTARHDHQYPPLARAPSFTPGHAGAGHLFRAGQADPGVRWEGRPGRRGGAGAGRCYADQRGQRFGVRRFLDGQDDAAQCADRQPA